MLMNVALELGFSDFKIFFALNPELRLQREIYITRIFEMISFSTNITCSTCAGRKMIPLNMRYRCPDRAIRDLGLVKQARTLVVLCCCLGDRCWKNTRMSKLVFFFKRAKVI